MFRTGGRFHAPYESELRNSESEKIKSKHNRSVEMHRENSVIGLAGQLVDHRRDALCERDAYIITLLQYNVYRAYTVHVVHTHTHTVYIYIYICYYYDLLLPIQDTVFTVKRVECR